MHAWIERLAIVLLALLVDALLGEPPSRVHPVVGIGKLVATLEGVAPRRSGSGGLVYGGLLTAATVVTTWGLSAMADGWSGRLPVLPRILGRAFLLKPTFAVRALFHTVEQVRLPLERGDLDSARATLRGLVSRETASLEASLVAAAAIESLAENAGDSIVAPLLAYLVAGAPAAYAYRAVNTLDAMIGYRGHYEYLGKCAARLDDVLNLVPSRLTAALLVLGAALSGADAMGALATAWRDHERTASPNAGWPMAAMAGALGVRLEKVVHYRLGEAFRPPGPGDLRQAERVAWTALGLGLLAAVGGGSLAVAILNRRSQR